jgi:external thioesterase TEII
MTEDIFCYLKKTGKQQLIFFPYLGGHASSFLSLAKACNKDTEVLALNLPGHGISKETALEDIDSVIDLCLESLKSIIKPHAVFFGHSMGGIIAYFLMHRILANPLYSIKPSALILSACSQPSEFENKNYSSLSDDDLLAKVISYGGISQALIDEKNFLQFLLPVFRSDFKILESSARLPITPLDIPIYFFWGEQDTLVTIDAAIKWKPYFNQNISLISLAKSKHLFIHTEEAYIIEQIDRIFEANMKG